MEEIHNISKAAKILNISPSSMRYWDEEGLLHFERNEENNYRYFSYHTMMDVCDVILYRSLAVPVKEVRKIPSMNIGELEALLSRNEEKLEKQRQDLEEKIEKVRHKQEVISLIHELEQNPGVVQHRQLKEIRPFSFYEDEMVKAYLDKPDRWALVIEFNKQGEIARGGMFMDGESLNPLRRRDEAEARYFRGLVKVEADKRNKNDGYQLYQMAAAAGYRPGRIIGRYLITAWEDKRYDYYEGLVELL